MKIKITARRDGYRRAGLQHTTRGRTFDVGDLTEEQREMLANDPNLHIVAVPVDGDEDRTGEGEEGGPAEPGPDGSNPPAAKVKPPSRKAGA